MSEAANHLPAGERGAIRLPQPQRPLGRPWMLTAYGLIMFACGMLIGSVSLRSSVAAPSPPAPLNAQVNLADRVTEQIESHFRLDASQQKQVQAIARKYERRLNSARLRFVLRNTPALDQFIDDIAQVLAPQQRERWRRSSQRQLERLKNRQAEGKSAQQNGGEFQHGAKRALTSGADQPA